MIRLNRLCLLAVLGVVGCDAAEYYPDHETPMRSADLRKDGPGGYGGNNSDFPVGTPGTGVQSPPPASSAPAVPSSAASAGSDVRLGSGGGSQIAESYSGVHNGLNSTDAHGNVPSDGTTTTGTAVGH